MKVNFSAVFVPRYFGLGFSVYWWHYEHVGLHIGADLDLGPLNFTLSLWPKLKK